MTMPSAPLVVFTLVLALGVIDLGFVVFRGTGSSVSNFLINSGFKSPMFTLSVGAALGHLYFYMVPMETYGTLAYGSWSHERWIVMGCSFVAWEGIRRVIAKLI